MLLAGIIVAVGVGVLGLAKFQDSRKDFLASEARQRGLDAASDGRWEEALPDLSLAAARYPEDVEMLLVFADVRSRIIEPESRHLRFALDVYLVALDRATNLEMDPEVKRKILRGLLRTQSRVGSIAGTQQAAMAILELYPQDRDALSALWILSKFTGEFLPDDGSLVVRGEGTDEEWLARLKSAGDESALRWVLELLVLDPDSIGYYEGVIEALREGGAESKQASQFGSSRESAFELIDGWEMNSNLPESSISLLRISHLLRAGDMAEAREMMAECVSKEMSPPDAVLRVSDFYRSLGTDEDRRTSRDLLSRVSGLGSLSTELRRELASRFWIQGNSAEAFQTLRVQEEDSVEGTADILALRAMLALLERHPDLDEFMQELIAVSRSPMVSEPVQELISILENLALTMQNPSDDAAELEEMASYVLSSYGGQNPLLLAIVGDCFATEGNSERAVSLYERALEITAGSAPPISRRLVRLRMALGQSRQAFGAAVQFFVSARTIESALTLLVAWNDLGFLGIDAGQITPDFSAWKTPLEMADDLGSRIGGQNDPVTLQLNYERLRALFIAGDFEGARTLVEDELGRDREFDYLARMIRFANATNLGLEEASLARLSEMDLEEDQELVRKTLMSVNLERAGRRIEAISILEGGIDSATGANRVRMLVRLVGMRESQGLPIESAFEELLGNPLSETQYRSLMGVVTRSGQDGLGRKLIAKARLEEGLPAPALLELEGMYVLRFEGESVESLLTAIERIDSEIIDSGMDMRLASLQARMLIVVAPSNPAPAIEILKEARVTDPDDVDATLILIDLLQRASRFEESKGLLADAERRATRLSITQRRRLATLLSRQGVEFANSEVICRLAESTNLEADLLKCLAARLRARELAEAEDVLSRIRNLETRTIPGEIAIADGFARAGLPRQGLEYLASTIGGSDAIQSKLAIANYAQRNQYFDRALAALDSEDPIVQGSAEAQLAIAMALLSDVNRADRVQLAVDALERAEELGSGQTAILRQSISLRLSEDALVESASPLIAQLAGSDPESAEFLGFVQAEIRTPPGSRIDPDLLSLGRRVLASKPRGRMLWQRVIRLFLKEFFAARSDGDVDAQERVLSDVRILATGFVARFPRSVDALLQLARVEMLSGDEESAERTLREIDSVATQGLTASQLQTLVLILVEVGDWKGIIDALDRNGNATEAILATNPALLRVFAAALLHDGQAGRALDLVGPFDSDGAMRDDAAQNWINVLQLSSSDGLIAGLDEVDKFDPPVNFQLASAQVAFRKYVEDREAPIEQALKTMIETVSGRDRTPHESLLLEIIQADLLSLDDAVGGLSRASNGIIARRALIDDLLAYDDLPVARRDAIYQSLTPMVIWSNNLLAKTGEFDKDALERFLSTGENLEALELADRFLAQIAGENPEVLDSRATYYLQVGRTSEARDLVDRAIASDKGNAAFLVTSSRILSAAGLVDQARLQLADAKRMALFSNDTQLLKVIARVENEIVGSPQLAP